MKRAIIVTLAVGVFFFLLFMVINILASSGIHNSYVSQYVLEERNMNLFSIPTWSACAGLWSLLQIELVARIIFLILFVVILAKLMVNNRKAKKLFMTALGVSLVSFVFIIPHFLAFTDIYHDYISKNNWIIRNTDVSTLPSWTNCNLEWNIIQTDVIIRVILLILLTLILVKLIRQYKKPMAV